ncbi:MAG: M48 family metallopeptidase [Eubacterium sp.]|nr:M48 family metallopeptidase [Eubacterium sp.]
MQEEEISYTLIRKNVKNINLRIKPDGSVVVSADPRVPRSYIDDFVMSKIPFIQKARDGMQQRKDGEEGRQLLTGERIAYLGGTLSLQVEQADRRLVPVWLEQVEQGRITQFSRNNDAEAVFCRDGRLYLYASEQSSQENRQQLFDSWQKIQAGILCRKISRQYYPVFEKLGIPYPKISIRKMRSRWGSCTPAKHKITFNSLLLEKPLESVEYVVVHEFSHFIHPNHSPAFYQFIEQILPDWRIRKEGLC